MFWVYLGEEDLLGVMCLESLPGLLGTFQGAEFYSFQIYGIEENKARFRNTPIHWPSNFYVHEPLKEF